MFEVQEEMAPPDGPEGKVEDQVLLFRNRSEAVLWENVVYVLQYINDVMNCKQL